MATIEQLSAALINADKAGDVQAARTLASEITRMRSMLQHGAFDTAAADNAAKAMSGMTQHPDTTRYQVDNQKALRDKVYSEGIFAGSRNPLGAIAKFSDAAVDAGTRWPMFGWDDEATAAAKTGFGMAGDYDQARKQAEALKNARREQNPVGDVVGTIGGMAAGAKGIPSLAGKVMEGGGGLLKTMMASGVDGAAMGALQGSGDAQPDDLLSGAGYGALGGAVIGGAIPAVSSAIGSTVKRAISPFLTSTQRQAAADNLRREGVNLTAGQTTGSNGLRYAESELGGGRVGDLMERQGEQFTAAALKRAGIDANRATPEVMDTAFHDIGGKFNTLASRNTLVPDQQILPDVGDVLRSYVSRTSDTTRVPIVREFAGEIAGKLSQGPLSGNTYQTLSTDLAREARAATSRGDGATADALYGLRESLDDGMERSMTAAKSPDVGAWQEARRQYQNFLVLEKAASGAGENAALGMISPAQLRSATVQKQGARNYVHGRTDFDELARSGVAAMTPLPNSGTAARTFFRNIMGAVPTGIAAGVASGGDPSTTVAGAAAGVAAPYLAGRMLLSRPAQAYLSNQAGKALTMSPQARAILSKILGIEGSQESVPVGRLVVGQ